MADSIWDPHRDIKRLQKGTSKLLKDIGKNIGKSFSTTIGQYKEPKTEISQDLDNVKINIELPSINKRDIALRVTNDRLEIKGEKRKKNIISKKGYFKKEIGYKGFYRSIALPTDVIPEETKAVFHNNILKIKIPKNNKIKKEIIVK